MKPAASVLAQFLYFLQLRAAASFPPAGGGEKMFGEVRWSERYKRHHGHSADLSSAPCGWRVLLCSLSSLEGLALLTCEDLVVSRVGARRKSIRRLILV